MDQVPGSHRRWLRYPWGLSDAVRALHQFCPRRRFEASGGQWRVPRRSLLSPQRVSRFAPPLRHRKDDIPLLVSAFTERFAQRLGKMIDSIPHDVIEAFQSYSWPGNIRELQNVVERAVIVARGNVLHVDEPLDVAATESAPLEHVKSSLEVVERRHIIRTLEGANWKISGKGGAAEFLGLNPSTLRARMRKLGIKRSD